MPLISETFESLPYVDQEPSAAERAAAEALITASLPPTDSLHPHIPSPPSSQPSALMAAEYERIAAKQSMKGIDLSRYETDEGVPVISLSALRSAENSEDPSATNPLAPLATNTTYVNRRHANLSLLEQFGKNAWLIANSQLEDMLRALERELAAAKAEIDALAVSRRDAQTAVAGELKLLEETWKKGVGRILETEVAAEEVRQEILRRRRLAAGMA